MSSRQHEPFRPVCEALLWLHPLLCTLGHRGFPPFPDDEACRPGPHMSLLWSLPLTMSSPAPPSWPGLPTMVVELSGAVLLTAGCLTTSGSPPARHRWWSRVLIVSRVSRHYQGPPRASVAPVALSEAALGAHCLCLCALHATAWPSAFLARPLRALLWCLRCPHVPSPAHARRCSEGRALASLRARTQHHLTMGLQTVLAGS